MAADQLATPQDLASLLQLDYATLSATQQATLLLLVEAGTGVVQAATGGQRIVQVADDVVDTMGTCDRWLQLPQIPVAKGDVSAVLLDGAAVTDWKQFGARLWRRCGWQTCWDEPSQVTVTYTHGYASDAQELQLGRSAVLSLTRGVFPNPAGVTSEAIDDYRVNYADMVAALTSAMDGSPFLARALRSQYGRRAGFVTFGQ